MKLQYISDNEGNTTAVVIPIEEWNEIKARHSDIAEAENDYELSESAKAILDERLATENISDFIPVEEMQKRLREKYGL
ncbi:addiction module component CHP02574 family protein [Flavobacterium psychrotrophum]|uniref:addiction module component CHP02574 family protein n=1 Tax=Flavobacterium psychrotrophum TaxID=2294119 RepID=UPI000E314527|nr:addiction module component CHP02574 family protein [Flavobacterium psychrotrophum]